MTQAYFYCLRIGYRLIYRSEKYLSSKSLIEKIILFTLFILAVSVPLYFYVIPFLNARTNHFKYIAHHQRLSHESTQAKAKALQESQEQHIMLEEVNDHIQNAYKPLDVFEVIWEDIIAQVSTLMLQAGMQNMKILVEDDQLSLSGASPISYLIKGLNMLERQIPLLQVKKLTLTAQEKDFSYTMHMQKITSSQDLPNIDTKELLLAYLNTSIPTFNVPDLLPDSPSFSPQTHHIPHFTLQAIINDSVKINHQWINIHDQIEGFEFMGIQACGALLQNTHNKICLSLPSHTPEKSTLP